MRPKPDDLWAQIVERALRQLPTDQEHPDTARTSGGMRAADNDPVLPPNILGPNGWLSSPK